MNGELQALLDACIDAVIIIDHRGSIMTFNRAASRMFGYEASQVIGRNVSMLMPSPDREQHDEYLARYLKTGNARVIGIGREVTAQRGDGSHFPASLAIGRIDGHAPPHFVGFLHDTSLRRKALATLEHERQVNRLYLDLAQVMLVATNRAGASGASIVLPRR